jgi:hypothetical protein
VYWGGFLWADINTTWSRQNFPLVMIKSVVPIRPNKAATVYEPNTWNIISVNNLQYYC